MKILVYGSNGWIGGQFINLLKEQNIDFITGISRVDNAEDVKNEIIQTNPTNIISFIGRTHGKVDDKVFSTIDYLEQKGKLQENIRDNLYSPILLGLICKDFNIHLTYIGTGCIFKYDNEHLCEEKNGFTEVSNPNFFGSSYSIVKGFTDRLMREVCNDNVLNLRIRMPISDTYNERNFITKITNYKQICSIPNSMTVLPELLPKIIDMMSLKITGTINLTNPGLISHNEILEMYKDIVDPTFTWNNFSEKEQSEILDSERSNNYLDTQKLEILFPDILHIKESVKNILYTYKNSII